MKLNKKFLSLLLAFAMIFSCFADIIPVAASSLPKEKTEELKGVKKGNKLEFAFEIPQNKSTRERAYTTDGGLEVSDYDFEAQGAGQNDTEIELITKGLNGAEFDWSALPGSEFKLIAKWNTTDGQSHEKPIGPITKDGVREFNVDWPVDGTLKGNAVLQSEYDQNIGIRVQFTPANSQGYGGKFKFKVTLEELAESRVDVKYVDPYGRELTDKADFPTGTMPKVTAEELEDVSIDLPKTSGQINMRADKDNLDLDALHSASDGLSYKVGGKVDGEKLTIDGKDYILDISQPNAKEVATILLAYQKDVVIPPVDVNGNPVKVADGYVRVTFDPTDKAQNTTKTVYDVRKDLTWEQATKSTIKPHVAEPTAPTPKDEKMNFIAWKDNEGKGQKLSEKTGTDTVAQTTFKAVFAADIIPIPDPDKPTPKPSDDYVKVSFDATKDGQFAENVQKKDFWVKKTVKTSSVKAQVTDPTFKDTAAKKVFDKWMEGNAAATFDDQTAVGENGRTYTATYRSDNTQPKPEEDKSKTPIVDPVDDGDTSISGKGEPGSDIIINIPGKDPIKTTVDDGGKWIAPIDPAHEGDVIKVVQIEVGKKPSDPAYVTVGGRSIIVPSHDDGGHWWIGGGSFKPVETEEQVIDKTEHGIHIAYIFGYKDHTFRCEGKITRAEAASMIAHIAKLDLSDNSKPDFKDTPSSWYNAAINAMVKKNLMFADKNGNFRPNEPITRGEFARAIQFIDKENKKEAPFMDIKGHEFEEAINQAYANGRIAGYPDGTFKPDESITRAEAVTILNNFDGRMVRERGIEDVKKDLIKFTDLKPSHWAYYEIIEASNSHAYSRISNDSKEEKWSNLIK